MAMSTRHSACTRATRRRSGSGSPASSLRSSGPGLGAREARLPSPPRRAGQATAVVSSLSSSPRSSWRIRSRSSTTSRATPRIANTHGTTTTNHLLSSSGSGRWQFWGAAVSEFRAHPLNGGGAGSWEAWWLQHGSLPGVFTQYRALALSRGAWRAGDRRPAAPRRGRPRRRRRRGSLGPRARERRDRRSRRVRHRLLRRRRVRLGLAARGYSRRRCRDARHRARGPSCKPCERVGTFRRRPAGARLDSRGGDHPAVRRPRRRAATCATARPPSTRATRRGPGRRLSRPRRSSRGRRARISQLGLLAEAEGDSRQASHWLDEAISRSSRDYSLWLTAARIEIRRGDPAAAKRDLAEARRLNPHSSALDRRRLKWRPSPGRSYGVSAHSDASVRCHTGGRRID